jgi:hypothetical protein
MNRVVVHPARVAMTSMVNMVRTAWFICAPEIESKSVSQIRII